MKRTYKIVFLGNTAVGKTTLISQYLGLGIDSPTPTIGMDFVTTTREIGDREVRLQVWDTAGQERFHSIVGNYTRNTFLAVVVFAVDDPRSVDQIEAWINDIVLAHNQKSEIRLMVVANKIDLGNGNVERGREVAERVGASFVRTSGLNRDGIIEMADAIGEIILSDRRGDEEEDDSAGRVIINARRKRGCC